MNVRSSRDIQVGSHPLQVSAEGYDGVTRSIEVAEAKIEQRRSRTWKFTIRTSNANPLLVFQREVDHAKSRLARKPE